MVTACVIGDVINSGKNYVVAINTEGWLYIFDVNKPSHSPTFAHRQPNETQIPSENDQLSSNISSSNLESMNDANDKVSGFKLSPLYEQRMPSNCKELLLADLDGDGQNEIIVGLTDRVLRTYKWIKIGPDRGKFVGLYKWEFADQIGSVSLNPSRHENCQDIIVAQPGGTYAKLECYDKKPSVISAPASNSETGIDQNADDDSQQNLLGTPTNGDNVQTEYISKLTPEYHQLALAQMRNHYISTEVLGGIRDGKNSKSFSLIVIATLDGTLMLVNKDEILWSLQVDHQLFALAIIESTQTPDGHPMLPQSESTCTIVPNDEINRSLNRDCLDQEKLKKSQYFVVSAWNGKTYIVDEDRNYLRFKFDEAVSAFTAGNYSFDGKEHASLVYATFNNQIVLYYDVILDQIRPMYLLDEIMSNPENSDLLEKLQIIADKTGIAVSKQSISPDNDIADEHTNQVRELLKDLLYNTTDEELNH